jgi:hypothetical protein
MAKLSISIKDTTADKLKDYTSREGLTVSAAIDRLLSKTLSDDYKEDEGGRGSKEICDKLDAIGTKLDGFTFEVAERLARVAAKGTKASLANLIATVTYLPALANLTDSTHHTTRKAWEKMGFVIRDQQVESDQATLLELRTKSPADMLKFCWACGGRASRAGASIDYAELTRGLKDQSFAGDKLDGIPDMFIDLLDEKIDTSQDAVDLSRLEYLNDQYERLTEQEASQAGLDPFERRQMAEIKKERKALKDAYLDRHGRVIGKIRSRLVPQDDGTWEVAL